IIVPLMISNLIAFYVSQRLQHEPIYEALPRQDVLHLPTGEFRRVARQFRVSAALQPGPPPLDAPLSIAKARRRTIDSTFDAWPVVDGGGLVGMVRVADIAAAADGGQSDAP